jgi:hypothetical protein
MEVNRPPAVYSVNTIQQVYDSTELEYVSPDLHYEGAPMAMHLQGNEHSAKETRLVTVNHS